MPRFLASLVPGHHGGLVRQFRKAWMDRKLGKRFPSFVLCLCPRSLGGKLKYGPWGIRTAVVQVTALPLGQVIFPH